MATLPRPRLSLEEYFAIERDAQFKSEYYDGQMFAMSGGTEAHNRIGFQLGGLIAPRLRGTTCSGFTSDQRVRAGELCTYPDLSIVCGEARFEPLDRDTLSNPTLVAEVLSPSTEAFDRGEKSSAYRQIPSLQEYLLISQRRPRVELYRRNPDGTWTLIEAAGLDASVELASIGHTLPLRDLYENVFPASS